MIRDLHHVEAGRGIQDLAGFEVAPQGVGGFPDQLAGAQEGTRGGGVERDKERHEGDAGHQGRHQEPLFTQQNLVQFEETRALVEYQFTRQ